MRPRLALVAFLPLLPLSLVACGGADGPKKVPANAVALVGDEPITRAVFASMLAANRQSYRLKGQVFPAVGTAAFRTARNKLLDQLVQEAEFEQHARSQFGIVIGDAQVDRQLEQLRARTSGGSEARFREALAQQGAHGGAGPGADPAAAARRGRLRPADRRGLGLRRRGRALLQKPPQGLRAAGQAPGSAHPRPHTRAGRRAGAQAANRRRLRHAREALLDRRRDGVVRRRPGRGHHAGPDAPRVRPGRLLAEDERDLGARPHGRAAGTSSRRRPTSRPERRRRCPRCGRRSRRRSCRRSGRTHSAGGSTRRGRRTRSASSTPRDSGPCRAEAI